jgi:hypothetical protein
MVLAAREEDGSFTPVRHPDGTVRRALARLQRHLIGQIVRVDKRAITATLEVTLPLATFADGAALDDPPGTALDITAIHTPLDMWVTGETLARPLYTIDWSDRHRITNQRGCWFRSGRIYLTGDADLWSDVARITVTYTPSPQAVDEDDDLVLPITAENAVIKGLAAYMAGRSKPGEISRPKNDFLQDAQAAETLWMDEARRRVGVVVTQTREDW